MRLHEWSLSEWPLPLFGFHSSASFAWAQVSVPAQSSVGDHEYLGERVGGGVCCWGRAHHFGPLRATHSLLLHPQKPCSSAVSQWLSCKQSCITLFVSSGGENHHALACAGVGARQSNQTLRGWAGVVGGWGGSGVCPVGALRQKSSLATHSRPCLASCHLRLYSHDGNVPGWCGVS